MLPYSKYGKINLCNKKVTKIRNYLLLCIRGYVASNNEDENVWKVNNVVAHGGNNLWYFYENNICSLKNSESL